MTLPPPGSSDLFDGEELQLLRLVADGLPSEAIARRMSPERTDRSTSAARAV